MKIDKLALPVEPSIPRFDGDIGSVPGVRIGVAEGAIKKPGRDDVLVIVAPGVAAGVTTQSTAAAAPCRWTRALLPGRVMALVNNAGNANASTGIQGEADVAVTAECVAEELGCTPNEVLVCSTGVIGVPMPMGRLLPAVRQACRTLGASGERAARSIMTTDLVPKRAAITLDGVTVGGIAKGSGMIHPNMATMLGFVATDAAVEADALQALVVSVAERTFNAITVDGDTSTNDTLVVFATGKGRSAAPGDAAWHALEAALLGVCTDLAKAIARDGEGATKLIEVVIEGLADDAAARAAARSVARGNLLKSAIYGRDANWGRVVGALGAAGVPDLDKLDLDLAGIPVLRAGRPVPFDEKEARAALSEADILIHGRLPGPGFGRAWGCDLTEDYVKINADYRS